MSTVPLEDRIELLDLMHRYCWHSDRREVDQVVALFTADAVFDETEIGLPRAEGRHAVKAMIESGLATVEHLIHYVTNHMVNDFTADTASGICFFLAEVLFKDSSHARVFGYYDDRYVKVDGQWRFRSRHVVRMMPTIRTPPTNG